MRATKRWTLSAALWALPPVVMAAACGRGNTTDDVWLGTIDTLPSGVISVTNPETGIWDEKTGWGVTEVLRVGASDGDGPDVFGQILDLAVDPNGRIYVFDGQAQELRTFSADGSHVRTIGRKGGGPGEFAQVIGMEWSPEGDLWLMDPQNNRISVIDTAGTYVTSHPAMGGFIVMPWPGGFDDRGRFYTYGLKVDRKPGDLFPLVFVRYDENLQPVDSAETPRYRGERNVFEHRSGRGGIMATVPHSPSVEWRFARNSDFWFVLTGDYEIYRQTFEGDTLSVYSKAFTPQPVTDEDLDRAREGLEWFTRQGGTIDLSKIPNTKPAVQGLFLDATGNIWIQPTTSVEDQGRVFEVFEPGGRYLGQVRFPFELRTNPLPVFQGDFVYGVTRDDLEVPYVVKARIGPGTTDTGSLTVGGP